MGNSSCKQPCWSSWMRSSTEHFHSTGIFIPQINNRSHCWKWFPLSVLRVVIFGDDFNCLLFSFLSVTEFGHQPYPRQGVLKDTWDKHAWIWDKGEPSLLESGFHNQRNIWHVPIWWPSHPGSLSYSLSRGFSWKPAPCLPLHSSQLIFIGATWVKHRCEGSDARWSNNFYNKCPSLSPKEGMTVLIMLMDVGIGSLKESIGGYFWELVRKLQENKTRVL